MNQTPEQLARDEIDRQLHACGWVVQDRDKFNLAASPGVAVRELQTSAGPADYVLFLDWKQFYSERGSLFIRTQDINRNMLDLKMLPLLICQQKLKVKEA